MLAEIKTDGPALNVEIIGINRADQAANNALVTSQRRLPWLQDTEEIGQWSSWNATWRDVRIVNSQTGLASVYNLTAHDLGVASHRSELKQRLLDSAVIIDNDGDGLRDDWETLYLQELQPQSGPDDDPDGDGYSNLVEYAFGSHPRVASSLPRLISSQVKSVDGTIHPALAFRRRAGENIGYACQESTNLFDWQASGSLFTFESVFDGTGTVLAACASAAPLSKEANRFFRVHVEFR